MGCLLVFLASNNIGLHELFFNEIVFSFFYLLLCSLLLLQSIPEGQSLKVNDYTNTLTADQVTRV
jgi:hypothetical protein